MATKSKAKEPSRRRPIQVVYDPDASSELANLRDKDERFAILTAVDKLRSLGPNLPFPHSSAVNGSSMGVRELRPRQGRSPYRPLYRRFDDFLIVLAIGHKDTFAGDVAVADKRAALYS